MEILNFSVCNFIFYFLLPFKTHLYLVWFCVFFLFPLKTMKRIYDYDLIRLNFIYFSARRQFVAHEKKILLKICEVVKILFSNRLLQDPLNQRLSWITPPSVVLIIKKNCSSLFGPFLEIIKHLVVNLWLNLFIS